MNMNVKCKKCRKPLFTEIDCGELLINAHSVNAKNGENAEAVCTSIQDERLLYLHEDFIPDWIRVSVEDEHWQKGKINCPYCSSRIGSFDFTSGMKCDCGLGVLPAVHLIKSKVDLLR